MKLKSTKIILNRKSYQKERYKANIIYVNLLGRIGNVMFQIAAAATLAKKHNCKLIGIPTRYKVAEPDNCFLSEYLDQFKYTILRELDICISPPTPLGTIYMEPFFHYSPIEYSPQMFLKGYFQSEKYFDPLLIKNIFKIDHHTQNVLRKKYGEILDLPDLTSINIRRGDYLKVQDQLPVCSLQYYNDAIDKMGRTKPYLITSDDLTWCRKNFKGDMFYFAEKTNPTYDLYLQSLCKNNIISNSTFSWWGAWLNMHTNKMVIAPEKWFGPTYKNHNTKDLIPEKWIKL